MKNIAISVGDINGIGLEILLRSHREISKFCNPFYLVDDDILETACNILGLELPRNMHTISIKNHCKYYNNKILSPCKITKESGEYSFISFKHAIVLAGSGEVSGVVTLPIHKEAWKQAGVEFIGHTHYLSHIYGEKGIMMLGCKEMFVALFSDHIPLREVSGIIKHKEILHFLLRFKNSFNFTQALVLGVNPHAGDGGIFGDEDNAINFAITQANKILGSEVFIGAYPPDSAFTPYNRQRFHIFVAMYHDQGLIPLKALYFDESINVTLGLPILRSSVDHGTAFDIAYKNKNPNNLSYIEACKFIINNARI